MADFTRFMIEKKRLGAKYIWVDTRYTDRCVYLFSKTQLDTLYEIMENDKCLLTKIFQRVCNEDNNGKFTPNEIKAKYYKYYNE